MSGNAMLLVAALLCLPALAGARPLVGGARLLDTYHLLYDGRTEEAAAAFREICPALPDPGACDTHLAVAALWRIRDDADDDSTDGKLGTTVERAIAETEAWTRRVKDLPAGDAQRAEAYFYLGSAYGVRTQFRILRGDKLAAARDGKRGKEALERAVALDPALHDAYFGIGLYRYYADLAPTLFKWFRWLLMLPGGDRKGGLRQLELAATQGTITRAEAAYQLALIRVWYERDVTGSMKLLTELAAQYPDNPTYMLQIAENYRGYLRDSPAAIVAARAVVDRASSPPRDSAAEMRGRYDLALTYRQCDEADRAIAQLEPLEADRAAVPPGLLPRALLTLGEAYDDLGRHDRAVALYRDAAAAARNADVRARALSLARRPPGRLRRAPSDD